MVFAAGRHDLQHDLGHTPLIITGLLTDLSKTGGIDIQGFHIHENLVVVNLHGVIQALGTLGQHALGLQHPVDAVGAA